MSSSEQQLVERIRRTLDRSVDSMDAATLARLGAARQRALAARRRPPAVYRRPAWLAACAAVLVAGVLVVLLRDAPPPAPLSDDELALMVVQDDLEMIEDLEFYLWLRNDPGQG